MSRTENNDKLRIRSAEELSRQMEGLVVLSKVLDATLDRWFLSGGTLLGAYRDGDFIPWDWDVEVTVLTEEAHPKESDILNQLVAQGFTITNSDSSYKNFKIAAAGWGTEYEILGRYLNRRTNTRARRSTEIPTNLFRNSEVITLRGKDFPAPSPIPDYLFSLYGDWETPIKSTENKVYYSKKAIIGGSFSLLQKAYRVLDRAAALNYLREFPAVVKEHFECFDYWDVLLGWSNPPNKTKVVKKKYLCRDKDQVSGLTVYSTDSKGSRSCCHPNSVPDITFFGDESCMCQDVHDEDTMAWHIGAMRKTRVSNYGVAGYGLDQALLRLHRDYKTDQADYVVMVVDSSTMARCCSVYKHYLNPGDIFCVKPRFHLESGGLQLVKSPVLKKEDLLRLNKSKKHFHLHDEHYSCWKKRRLAYFAKMPYIGKLINFGLCSSEKRIAKIEYEMGFWKSHSELFYGMMSFYNDMADAYHFKPIFFLRHSDDVFQYVKDMPKQSVPWFSTLRAAEKKIPNILFLDDLDLHIRHGAHSDFCNLQDDLQVSNYIRAQFLENQINKKL